MSLASHPPREAPGPANAPTTHAAARAMGRLAGHAHALAKQPPWNAPPVTQFGPPLRTETEANEYHPLVQSTIMAMTAMPSAAARLDALTAWLQWADNAKRFAEQALTASGLAADLPANLSKTPIPSADWPFASKQNFLYAYEGVAVGLGGAASSAEHLETTDAYQALTDASTLATAAADPTQAAYLLLQIRCLADVYTRWEIAARATAIVYPQQAASPPLSRPELMARTLAYFRAEGGCGVPPDDETLEGTGRPIPLPPGRSRFTANIGPVPRFAVGCVSVLLDATRVGASDYLAAYEPYVGAGAPVEKVGDLEFTVMLGGLDILWVTDMQVDAESFAPGSTLFAPADRFAWPALNRQASSGVNARADAQADAASRLAFVVSRDKASSVAVGRRVSLVGPGGYSGNFSGPVAHYCTLVLTEGLRYLDRLAFGPTRFGTAGTPTRRLPEILVYALYHVGSNSPAFFISACAAALDPRSTSTQAVALRRALQSNGLTDALKQTIRTIAHASRGASSAIAAWKDLAPLIGHASVTPALANYLRHEGVAVWRTWAGNELDVDKLSDPKTQRAAGSNRANCVGYAQLYEYFVGEFGP